MSSDVRLLQELFDHCSPCHTAPAKHIFQPNLESKTETSVFFAALLDVMVDFVSFGPLSK